MRLRLVQIAVVLLNLVCLEARASQPQISLTINTDHPTVKTGDDVFIKIEMKNESDHDVDCTKVYSDGVDLRYHYDVKDGFGNMTGKLPRKHPEVGDSGSFYVCTLHPRQSTGANDSRVSSLLDLKKPGKYTVQVWRFVEGNLVVRSNSIEITVTP